MKTVMIGTLASAAFLLASPAIAAPPQGLPDGWSEGFVFANGARLHYYHAIPNPGKPTVVMVHGITDNGLSWTTLTRDLEKSYDIYMIDARGHGLSDPFTDADDGTTQVKDVVGFIQAMKIEKPILMGHSLGGATVMRVGADYADLPRAVIMLDPAGINGTPRPATAAAPAPVPSPATAAAAAPAERRPGSMNMFTSPETLVAQNNDTQENYVATCARQTPLWDPADCQYWALSKRQYHGAYTPAQQQALRGVMATGDALSRIVVPTIILKADTSAEGRENNLRAAAVMKNGSLVHIDGAGHNLHHDKRARTVEVLNAFLGKLPK
jgi:pimeloyl-ACP methyl ester carboxylesterase